MAKPDKPVGPPRPATLRKYGLAELDWWLMWRAQGEVCGICKTVPRTGTVCTDHEHVRGWAKMKPEMRKQYVRGLLCWTCNHVIVRRGVTIPKLRNAAEYLETYEARKAKCD